MKSLQIPEKLNLINLWKEHYTKVKDREFMLRDELDITKALWGIHQIERKINELLEYLENTKEAKKP